MSRLFPPANRLALSITAVKSINSNKYYSSRSYGIHLAYKKVIYDISLAVKETYIRREEKKRECYAGKKRLLDIHSLSPSSSNDDDDAITLA